MLLLNSASASVEKGEVNKGAQLLARAMRINGQPPCDEAAHAATMLAQARVHEKDGNAEEARKTIAKARSIAEQHNDAAALEEADKRSAQL